MQSTDASEDPEPDWSQLAPLIDEALASLSAKDRNAVLLRFFENKSFGQIGETLGANENSARLRVVRALEKLRGFFKKRGIRLSSEWLSAALLVPSSQAVPPGLAGSAMRAVTCLDCPASIAGFIRVIRRATWLRSRLLWASGLVAACFLAVVLAGLLREDPVRIRTQVRATALSIDDAISFGDGNTFVANVHFRNAEQEQLKPVFAAFLRAAAGLRNQVNATFGAQPVQLQIWFWTAGELLYGQPRAGENTLPSGQVTDDFFQPYLMVMVKEDRVWKWDFFSNLSPNQARERMKVLQEKTALCETLTRQIQKGEIATTAQVLARLHEPSH